jgi:2-furoyl-CoA dehydrogenase large subunit
MTLGGIAHGVGAALMEEFIYDEHGQMVTQTFMDYLLPSAHEVPNIDIVHYCTPSPFTVFGQKGSGESGYLGASAAIASAINDATGPLGVAFDALPIRIATIGDAIAAARERSAPARSSAVAVRLCQCAVGCWRRPAPALICRPGLPVGRRPPPMDLASCPSSERA